MAVWQIALETSGRQGSVALLREDLPVEQIVLDKSARTAQAIGPAVEFMIKSLAGYGQPLSFVSVASGPGSFTGLRIGVTAAKSLAFALECPVVACDTLDILIRQARNTPIKQLLDSYPTEFDQTKSGVTTERLLRTVPLQIQIDAAINAYRGQVFCRRSSLDGSWNRETMVCDVEQWLEELTLDADHCSATRPPQKILVTGDAWLNRQPIHANISIINPQLWQPTAAEVGKKGWEQYLLSQSQDCLSLVPNYLRESAAVELRNKSQNH